MVAGYSVFDFEEGLVGTVQYRKDPDVWSIADIRVERRYEDRGYAILFNALIKINILRSSNIEKSFVEITLINDFIKNAFHRVFGVVHDVEYSQIGRAHV